MRYCMGKDDVGVSYEIIDPRTKEITDALQNKSTAREIYHALSYLPGLFPEKLIKTKIWEQAVTSHLSVMLNQSMAASTLLALAK